MDKYVYPAIFKQDKGTGEYTVEFPDMEYCHASGDSFEEAISNARSRLGVDLVIREIYDDLIPPASDPLSLEKPADAFVISIDVEMLPFRQRVDTRYVKKRVRIPLNLAEWALYNSISLSKVLQEALEVELEVVDPYGPGQTELNKLMTTEKVRLNYVFPGFFQREDIGKYTAVFPDFPDIRTEGRHLDGALYWAKKKLGKHISFLLTEEMPIPDASNPLTLEKAEKSTIVQVEIDLWENGESIRETIKIRKWLDDLAKAQNIDPIKVLMKILKPE